MEKAIECITKKYADFSGRASRSEYWYFAFFMFIVGLLLGMMDILIGTYDANSKQGLLSSLFSIATIVPAIAVAVRRLHDLNKTGWFLLIGLIPIIGAIWLFVLYCTKGTKGDNRFGSDPLQV